MDDERPLWNEVSAQMLEGAIKEFLGFKVPKFVFKHRVQEMNNRTDSALLNPAISYQFALVLNEMCEITVPPGTVISHIFFIKYEGQMKQNVFMKSSIFHNITKKI